jgi:hypothetical protein
MTKQEFQNRSMEMINDLFTSVVNNQINILGTVYTIVKKGNHFITVSGAKGAIYTISTSPKSTVMESKECGVYYISGSNGRNIKNFTFFDGNTVTLEHA